MHEAIETVGAGSGGTRNISGTTHYHVELEAELADLHGKEAALLFTSAYIANDATLSTLQRLIPGLVIFSDEKNHASMIQGIRHGGGEKHIFRHNDVDHARALLDAHRTQHDRALIVTDGVFSMDGDIAPLENLLALAERYDAWLMSDDAHGIGVLGGGRGSSFSDNSHIAVPLQMGTLSKAIGSYGGYLCASESVIELMRNRARTLIYSTGLPPASVAAAIAALDLIEREPAYAALPVAKAKAFTRRAGLAEAQSPIVPIVIGDEGAALSASRALEDEGFMVIAIRPPTVPAGTARLRLTFTAQHPDDEITRLADIVRDRWLA